MTERVRFIGWHPDDVLGANEWARAAPEPTPVEAEILAENGDGSVVLAVGSTVIGDAREGTGPGAFRRIGGLAPAQVRAIRQGLATLRADTNPKIAGLATAVTALFRLVLDDLTD